MLVKVKIKGAGKPYLYIAPKSCKIGDKVRVGAYRNDIVGVEGVIVEINCKRDYKRTIHRIKEKINVQR